MVVAKNVPLVGEVTFVKACKHFFEGEKVTFDEFKALSMDERQELRTMLIDAGYEVAPLAVA